MMKASVLACIFSAAAAYEQEWAEFQAVNGARNGAIPQAFKDNVDKVKEHNSNPDNTFTLSYTSPFADLSAEDFKSSMLSGLKPSAEERVSLGVFQATGAEVPDSIDWSDKGAVTPVKNQGSCGSCWAFSTVGSLEGRAQLAKGNLQQFSEQQFVDCDKDFGDQGCNGGLMDNAFKYAEQADICTEDSYAYKGKGGSCAASGCSVGLKTGEVSGFVDVKTNDEQALMEAVAAGPVSVAVDAVTLFQLYFGGIMSGLCGASLDHGVLVVGYGTDNGKDYWKVKNSWGSSWGEKGYVRMLRGKGGKGQCGILSGPPSYPVIGGSSVTV
jgi:C1A family cysteine protease